jgi:hypothetical protein
MIVEVESKNTFFQTGDTHTPRIFVFKFNKNLEEAQTENMAEKYIHIEYTVYCIV